MIESIRYKSFKGVRSVGDLGPLVDGIHECTQSAFGSPDFSREDVLRHVESDYLLMMMEGNRVGGFSSIIFGSPNAILGNDSLPDVDGCYLAAAAISESVKGRGLYQPMNEQLLDIALKGRRESILFTRTQNPLVETSISHSLDRREKEAEISGYALTRYLVPAYYGRMLSERIPPRSSDSKIQDAHNKLDLRAGDAFVLIYNIGYSNGGVAFLK